MTTFMEDLRTLLVATTSLADALGTTTAVHYNHVPGQTLNPYIWYRTGSDTVPLTLDGVGGLHEANLDIEIIATSESAAQGVADKLHAKLHGFKGTVGNSSAQAIFLEAKDDDYQPRGIENDDGRHVIAYDLRAWYST